MCNVSFLAPYISPQRHIFIEYYYKVLKYFNHQVLLAPPSQKSKRLDMCSPCCWSCCPAGWILIAWHRVATGRRRRWVLPLPSCLTSMLESTTAPETVRTEGNSFLRLLRRDLQEESRQRWASQRGPGDRPKVKGR